MSYQAPALDKGLDILEFLAQQSEPVTQKTLASGLNRSQNEIYRMLVRLEERGYVRRDPISSGYELTLKLYVLSRGQESIETLRSTALPVLRRLSAETKQTSHVTTIYEQSIVIVTTALSPGPISVMMREGRTYPILSSTSGRLLLSQLTPSERSSYLSDVPDFQLMSDESKAQFLSAIEEAGGNGHLVRKSGLTDGITDISASVGNEESPIKVALSLVCLSSELNSAIPLDRMLREAKKAAREIAFSLGFQ